MRMSGGLLKLVRQILFFCTAVMDGRCSVNWWWSRFYVKFFERFVVKRVCFFADDVFDSF